LEVGRGANNPTLGKSTITKHPEPIEKGYSGGQDPHSVVAPVKKKKKKY
jgi:hypothetical protein